MQTETHQSTCSHSILPVFSSQSECAIRFSAPPGEWCSSINFYEHYSTMPIESRSAVIYVALLTRFYSAMKRARAVETVFV
jgi:hypothetical protein